MSRGKLIAAYLFGSAGRGQIDDLSDLDILAIVENNQGKVAEVAVTQLIPGQYAHLKPSISWYGAARVIEMFRNGELFAWHLYQESVPLFDPSGLLVKLGQPAVYKDSLQDMLSFRSILQGIPTQVQNSSVNAAYEAGLVYICMRNIAMAASWLLCEKPDFSRYSIFHLEGMRRCPISIEEFDITMHCRMASQRGYEPPVEATALFIFDIYGRLDPWFDELEALVIRKTNEAKHA